MSGEEIEAKLAQAAAGVREYELVSRRCEELRRGITAQRATLDRLREQHVQEAHDVQRLEGPSLTAIIAALRGSREQTLAREKAEADAAAYRVREATEQLNTMVRELQQTDVRLARLSLSRHAHAAALADREQFLMGGKDRRGTRLGELAEARGRLEVELAEVDEAISCANDAKQALAHLEYLLLDASDWSNYDTFFGGGLLSSAIKHSRLDDAALAARGADRALARLRTELADVPGAQASLPGLNVEGMTRFVDIWLDNIIVDLAVRSRINAAKESVRQAALRVDQVLFRLTTRRTDGQERLSAIAAERQRLLSLKA